MELQSILSSTEYGPEKGIKTVHLESCIVQEQQGFACESNTISAQDVCLDTEQNVRHFEVCPDNQ